MDLMTQLEFSNLIGVTQGTVSNYLRQGKISPASIVQHGNRKRIIPQKALMDLERNLKPSQFLKIARHLDVDPPSDLEDDDSYLNARTWSERYRAANRKLDFEIKQGKWLRKSTVKDKGFKVARLCRDALQNIPDRISALVAAEKDPGKCKAIVRKEVDMVVTDFLNSLKAIAR